MNPAGITNIARYFGIGYNHGMISNSFIKTIGYLDSVILLVTWEDIDTGVEVVTQHTADEDRSKVAKCLMNQAEIGNIEDEEERQQALRDAIIAWGF